MPEDPEDAEILDVYQIQVEDEIGLEEIPQRIKQDVVMTPEDWKIATQQDVVLSAVYDRLKKEIMYTKQERKEANQELTSYIDRWDQLHIEQGCVFMREPRPWGWIRRLCLPQSTISKVLYWAHYDRFAGHFGRDKP